MSAQTAATDTMTDTTDRHVKTHVDTVNAVAAADHELATRERRLCGKQQHPGNQMIEGGKQRGKDGGRKTLFMSYVGFDIGMLSLSLESRPQREQG